MRTVPAEQPHPAVINPVRLAAAATVVVLDLPAWTCLLGVLQRRARYRGGQHPETGVYDRLNVSFLRYIAGYQRSMLPWVQADR